MLDSSAGASPQVCHPETARVCSCRSHSQGCQSYTYLFQHGHGSPFTDISASFSETVAPFDQFFQPLSEACCRGAVDQIMIETQCYREVFADGYLPVNNTWLLSDAAQSKIKGMLSDRDAPTSTFPKHANRR